MPLAAAHLVAAVVLPCRPLILWGDEAQTHPQAGTLRGAESWSSRLREQVGFHLPSENRWISDSGRIRLLQPCWVRRTQ